MQHTSSVCLLANNFRSISSPFRGAFHLSLAVLVHYRSCFVFSLGWWPTQIPTGFRVSRSTWEQNRVTWDFKYEVFTLYDLPFQAILLSLVNPTTSAPQPPSPFDVQITEILFTGITCIYTPNGEGFRLFRFRSPLLTESLLISFPHLTEMFQFRCLPASHYSDLAVIFTTGSPTNRRGFPIRKPPDHRSMAPTRRVSPPYASFLGKTSLGIHCWPYE